MKTDNLFFVSIVVAARNEADNILACLQALYALNYPKHLFEVWIGNDHSEDETAYLIEQFIQGKENFHLLNITKQVDKLQGKTNVLAQLIPQTRGELIFITDADTQVPSSWVQGMLANYTPSVGIVTGFTLVAGKSVFAKLQGIDWAYALFLIKTLSDKKFRMTAMGNNMMVSKKAYDSVGGYTNIPFSIIEDYALFQAVASNGWDFKNVIDRSVLAFTKPPVSFLQFLHQRKRWMSGAMQVPWYFRIAFFLQAFFCVFLLVGFFFFPEITGWLWGIKVAVQTLTIANVFRKVKAFIYLPYVILYEVYILVVSLLTVGFYYLPTKVNWKGRIYKT